MCRESVSFEVSKNKKKVIIKVITLYKYIIFIRFQKKIYITVIISSYQLYLYICLKNLKPVQN